MGWDSRRLASGRLVRVPGPPREGKSGLRTAASPPAGPDCSSLPRARVILPASATRVRRGVSPGTCMRKAQDSVGRSLRGGRGVIRVRMYNSAVRSPVWAGRVGTSGQARLSYVGAAFVPGWSASEWSIVVRHGFLTAAIGVGSSDSPNPSGRQSPAKGWGPSWAYAPARGGCRGSAWDGRRAGGWS